MAAIVNEAPPRRRAIGHRTLGALFLAMVGAILGAVPGWSMCFSAWLVFSWLVLGCVVFSSTLLSVAAAVARDWRSLRVEARQLLNVALLMLAMLPLGMLSIGVEFAFARPGLVARAEASARAGGPAIAMTPASRDDWPMPEHGFIYDRQGLVAMPPSQRAAAWRDDPVLTAMASECVTLSHLGGAYWRWSVGCDGI